MLFCSNAVHLYVLFCLRRTPIFVFVPRRSLGPGQRIPRLFLRSVLGRKPHRWSNGASAAFVGLELLREILRREFKERGVLWRQEILTLWNSRSFEFIRGSLLVTVPPLRDDVTLAGHSHSPQTFGVRLGFTNNGAIRLANIKS